jgi:ribonuclease HI
MLSLSIYTDGGARGNPGPAACAFVVKEGDRKIYEDARYIGNSTNNIAEYEGLIMALKWLMNEYSVEKPTHIDFYLDSELVVNQVIGKYRIKSVNLKPLIKKVRELEKKIDVEINYFAVRRDKNKLADFLLNKKIDENI